MVEVSLGLAPGEVLLAPETGGPRGREVAPPQGCDLSGGV